MEIKVASENALIVYLSTSTDQTISSQLNHQVAALATEVGRLLQPLIIDLIPSYSSLLVIFNPLATDHHYIRKQLQLIASKLPKSQAHTRGQHHEIPVLYDHESTPDLEDMAQNLALEKKQIIALHQATTYQVFAIGFSPGFAFLGEVNEQIAMPRRVSPRRSVPAGAVAIADRQTAVYPSDSPGGWNLIGLCPLNLRLNETQSGLKLAVGDSVRFNAIDQLAFNKLRQSQ